MAEGPLLPAEEFTIRQPLFVVGLLAFLLATLGGLLADWFQGDVLAMALDGLTLVVLSVIAASVWIWKVERSVAVAAMLYTGALNFAVAFVQILLTHRGNVEAALYNNLFVMALFLGLGTFLVGKSASLVFGALILGILVGSAWYSRDLGIEASLLFEVPAVLGASFLLFQYRRSLDRLLKDLQNAIRENKVLRERNRLADLGEMTAGIAHEIKNPLNFVVNFAESSQELLTDLEALRTKSNPTSEDEEEMQYLLREIRQNLVDIQTQGLRGASTVQSMLIQARSRSGDFQAVDLNELAEECLRLAWLGYRVPGGRHRFEPWPTPVLIKASRADLSRALLNLCSNALWSVAEKGRRKDTFTTPEVVVRVEVTGVEARVSVIDNGLGLSAQTKAQLFTPFFTTKPAGEGTGLGLSLTREVVMEQHGGRVEFDGDPEWGARFSIILPLLGGSP